VDVDRLQAEVGATVDLSVLLVGGNGNVQVGTPTVDGARVVAEVIEHGRGEKLLVFKYKNKTRYRRRQGHRQDFTRLSIKQIVTPGGTATAEEKPRRSRRSLAEPEPEPEAKVEATTAEAALEAPKKPSRARTPAAAKTAEPKAPSARKPRAKKAPAVEAQAEDTPEAEQAAEAAADIEAPTTLPPDEETK
jgi:large subunit ribosomal protein L21